MEFWDLKWQICANSFQFPTFSNNFGLIHLADFKMNFTVSILASLKLDQNSKLHIFFNITVTNYLLQGKKRFCCGPQNWKWWVNGSLSKKLLPDVTVQGKKWLYDFCSDKFCPNNICSTRKCTLIIMDT